jgi:hypothetical protein
MIADRVYLKAPREDGSSPGILRPLQGALWDARSFPDRFAFRKFRVDCFWNRP